MKDHTVFYQVLEVY